MSVDVDMIISPYHFITIGEKLDVTNFICDTNVKRLEFKDYCDDYALMLNKSKPWRLNDVNQLFNSANGGFQVYSYVFFEAMNGIQESLGLYHGAVDNVVYYRARMWGLNTIDISYPLLHLEHTKQKEENYAPNERLLAQDYRIYKAGYLNYMIKNDIATNPETIGEKYPNITLFLEFKQMLAMKDKIIQEAINKGEKSVQLGYNTFDINLEKPSILIAIINNRGEVPDYFMMDLINLIDVTRNVGYDVTLLPTTATEVSTMRNMAVKMATGQEGGRKYDYLVQLDTDHRYHPEFLVDFLDKMTKNNWPILTGMTSRKTKPYNSTQYYKIIDKINEDSNCVKCTKPTDEIIQIEASGPVGMVMSTEIFKELKFPYYAMEYTKIKDKINILEDGKVVEKDVEKDSFIGSDIAFCKKLKEKNIPIRLCLGVSFPHEKKLFINRNKVIE